VEWLETADYIPSGLDLVILGVSDDSAFGEINEFNSQNQIAVTYVGDKTIQFSYNGDGIRVGKNVNGNIEKYLYDTGNHVVLEVNGDGGQIAENIYGIYNVARVVDGESYTYLHNGHGDVVALIDSEENAVNRYTYDAFGVILTSTETVENPFRYAGYWYDSETGLYYLMARYYNSVNGRFLSEDPVRDGYNWYVYCDNNPIIYVDPNGEAWETIFDIISLGFSIVDVISNPDDGWAWAGLAGDVIDFIPFVTGVGEVLKSAGAAYKTADLVVDTAKATKAVDIATSSVKNVAKKIANADRVGSALKKKDIYHRAAGYLTEEQLSKGVVEYIIGGDNITRTMLKVEGEIDGVKGVFEYILEPNGTVSHQLFRTSKNIAR